MKVYVGRDDTGKIVSMGRFPAPDMDPPITEEIDLNDPEVEEYIESERKLGKPQNWDV